MLKVQKSLKWLVTVYAGVSEPNLGSAVGFSKCSAWKMATLKRGLGGSKRSGRPLLRLAASYPQRSSLNLVNGKPGVLDRVANIKCYCYLPAM